MNPNSRRKQHERPAPSGSSLITDEENKRLFQELGKDRITLSAGVVQLLCAQKDTPGVWSRVSVGVALLIKDYISRNYAIGLYDILANQLVWTQPLYRRFRAHTYPTCPRLIAFEGDTCVFGLNFYDFNEAAKFEEHLSKRYEQEAKSAQREQHTVDLDRPQRNGQYHTSQYPSQGNLATAGITNIGTVPHFTSHSDMTFNPSNKDNLAKKLKKGRDKKPKHRKEDIGNPIDFRHIAHVGWEDQKLKPKVYDEGQIDQSICNILRAAGQNPDEMPNHENYKHQTSTPNPDTAYPNVDGSWSPPVQITAPPAQKSNRDHSRIEHQQSDWISSNYQHNQYNVHSQTIKKNEQIYNQQPLRPPPMQNHREFGIPLPQAPRVYQNGIENNRVQLHRQQRETHSENQVAQTNREKPPPPPPPPIPTLPPHIQHSQHNVPKQHKEAVGFTPQLNSSDSLATISQNAPPPPPPPPVGLLAVAAKEKGQEQNHASLSANTNANATSASLNANLLQQIQQGTRLRKVSPDDRPAGPIPSNPPTTHDNMMSEIKQGTTLKHVDQSEADRRSGANVKDLTGIAGALARALEQRRKNLVNSEVRSKKEEVGAMCSKTVSLYKNMIRPLSSVASTSNSLSPHYDLQVVHYNDRKWNIGVAISLFRAQVIAKMADIEKKFQEMCKDIDDESSLKNEFELRLEKDETQKQQMSEISSEAKIMPWQLPFLLTANGESLRQVHHISLILKTTADRCLSSTLFTQDCIQRARVLGNVPFAHYRYKYPEKLKRNHATDGAILFLFACQFLTPRYVASGEELPITFNPCIADYRWVTSEEVREIIRNKKYITALKSIMIE